LQYVLLAFVVVLCAHPVHEAEWHGDAALHTQLEAISSLLAMMAGCMALVRYYAKKSSEFLLLGSCFLGAGVLDAYHALITASFFAGHTPSGLSALTPWSGAVSRVYMSALMCVTLVAWYREERHPEAPLIRESVVYLSTGMWAVATFVFFAEVHVPPAYYPNLALHRPAQLIQASFFAIAVAGYLKKGKWKSSEFEHFLVLALIAATASDFMYMAFYHTLYDAQFMVGHVLKVVVYLFVMAGLLTNSFSIFKREAENATQLEARVLERTQELSRANVVLAEEIAEREDAQNKLRAAIVAAEAASRAKSEFLANMSHEIRTPLNGVIGMTELAMDTELSAEQRDYLGTVKLSADALLVLINDILDFSKIEAGKVELEEADFALRESLNATLRTVTLRACEKGLELRCEVAPEVPEYVRGDAVRLRQILLNLVGNAIKFTARGEIALRVEGNTASGANGLHFTVTDTGIGIPAEKRQTIFEPFSQADASTTRNYGGTGLGLTISTRLVELMGGSIWVESEVGRGTQFHFTVRMGAAVAPAEDPAEPRSVNPLSPSDLHDAVKRALGANKEAERLRAKQAAQPPSKNQIFLSVLVAEDNSVNQLLIARVLEKRGHRVVVVGNGREALEALKRGQFDLVLMDVQMPEMDGLTATETLRKSEINQGRHQPVVALTANAMKGDKERCLAAGMDGYLTKPICATELDELLRGYLQHRRELLSQGTETVVPS